MSGHWRNLPPEDLERYARMFRWNPASAGLYEAAAIGPGQRVADFGCGPGHAAVEFARRVGPAGHVHAFDINAEFIAMARANAAEAGLADRITPCLLGGPALPLPDRALDRVVARNTLVYVDDPAALLAEFHRVLAPGGRAHMIEGDWRLTAVEPIAEWPELVAAASHAWRCPEMGRRLPGLARRAGFAPVETRVLANPDTDGRLRGMIEGVAGQARRGGMDAGAVAAILARVDAAIADRTYLAVVPQFVVTAHHAAPVAGGEGDRP